MVKMYSAWTCALGSNLIFDHCIINIYSTLIFFCKHVNHQEQPCFCKLIGVFEISSRRHPKFDTLRMINLLLPNINVYNSRAWLQLPGNLFDSTYPSGYYPHILLAKWHPLQAAPKILFMFSVNFRSELFLFDSGFFP